MRTFLFCLAIYLQSSVVYAVSLEDERQAFADKQNFPQEIREYLIYHALDVPAKDQAQLEAALKVVVCSLSRMTHLPSQLPVRVKGTNLVRMDLRALAWEKVYGKILTDHYPYRPDLTRGKPHPTYPTVISGLWFVSNITDPVRTGNAQDLLLYGEKPPTTLKELYAFWKVNSAVENTYGFIEEESGVAEARTRFVEEFPSGIRTYAFGTKDSRNIKNKNDPLANLVPGTAKFDASEIIIGIPKTSTRKFGVLQAYWLVDGEGKRVDKAPADIVADKFATRTHEIRNWVSCIACHSEGLITTSTDGYTRYFKAGAGAEVYDYQTQQQIQQYLEIDMGGRIKSAQSMYADGVDMVCGLKPAEFATAYVSMIKRYDDNLSLDTAALEVGCEPEKLKLALAYQSAKKINLDPRLVQLGHGVPILRVRWESLAPLAAYYVAQYEKE